MIILTFMYAYILYTVYHLQQNHGRGKKGLSHMRQALFSCRGAHVGRPFTQNLVYKYPTYTWRAALWDGPYERLAANCGLRAALWDGPYERLAANCGLRDALWASPTNG